MKLLYSSPNILAVGHIRNLLDVEGIECQLKNEFLSGGMGDLPAIEAWPELWVDDQDLPAAQKVLDKFFRESEDVPPDWTCPSCGERIEGQFSACWQCGAEKPQDQ